MNGFITLYDAIKANGEQEFAEAVHSAVLDALVSLGPDIQHLDWAHASARAATDLAKAA